MTAPRLDTVRLATAMAADPEFRLQARYLSTSIRVVVGDSQRFTIQVRDGVVTEIDPEVTLFDPYAVLLQGTEEQWSKLLAAVPEPFYQDFFPAALRHGFRLEGDLETIMAYYPALRRLGDLMRSVSPAAVTA
ncbi:hypothetical protein LWC35_03120 [Pseudonocardia kujensis]|uniref:hypothetical protein n=1 Tax=Pseudonocardia kujensis TaxID=1128675 RepID=UPI001E3B75E0|nr:hypothetical protein [Pseudonocardia kujensis]MCE0761907.1 hypothetical protein [Pseudonocardia kujensis]